MIKKRQRPRSYDVLWTACHIIASAAAEADPAAATPCPSDRTIPGYSDLDSLQSALELSSTTDFILCPSTTYSLDKSIRISRNDTIISCGVDGDVVNECVLMGKITPFLLNDNVTGTIVQGVTLGAELLLPETIWCQDCKILNAAATAQECFSTAESLVTALKSQKRGSEYHICEKIGLILDQPLEIHEDNVVILCGENGTRDEQCVLIGGGESQIHIRSDGVRLKGLTLSGSRGSVSVLCSGDHKSKLVIQDCEFSGHEDTIALLIHNSTQSFKTNSTWKEIMTANASSMEVTVEMCSFMDNRLREAAIVNVNGVLVVSNSTFDGNSGHAIIASTGSSYVDDSCFINNDISATGLVLVSNATSLGGDVGGNFESGNVAGTNVCLGVFAQDDRSCVVFTAESCVASKNNTASQSAGEPTVLPTKKAIKVPPTNEPSSLMTSSTPLAIPSAIPSILPKTIALEMQSIMPSLIPSTAEMTFNSLSYQPSQIPSGVPSNEPSYIPSDLPSFTTSPTALLNATDDTCVSDLESLLEATNSNFDNKTVSVCNSTVFDLSKRHLLIEASNVTINCPGCVFRGGTRHIEFQGEVGNVVIRGITFSEVDGESVYANISSSSSIQFEECTWAENTGPATVNLTNPNFREPPEEASPGDDIEANIDDDIFPRELKDGLLADNIPIFNCNQCVFEANLGVDGIVVSTGVAIQLHQTIFESNQVDGSVINAPNDRVSITSSCFIGNLYEERLATTDISSTSLRNNFGTNNTKGVGLEPCDGLGTAASCQSFESDTCLLDLLFSGNSTDPENPDNSTCFDDWSLLKQGIEQNSNGTKSVFTLCANTTIEADMPIAIKNSDVIVRCGSDGEANNCTISGGQSHFIIKGIALSTSFVGVSFKNARSISIMGFSAVDSRAVFSKCLWENNLGPAVVLVYNEVDGLPFTNQRVEALSKPKVSAMTTIFESCSYRLNEATFAALAVVDGEATVSNCSFEGHKDLQAGVIAGTEGAKLSLFASCFVDNDSLTAATVFLDPSSELTDSGLENYGYSNSVRSDSDCKAILEATLDTCLVDGACAGFCTAFEGNRCNLPFVNYSHPPTLVNETEKGDVDGSQKNNNLTNLVFRGASLGAHGIINILMIVLTLIGWAYMYFRCKKSHLIPKPRPVSLESAPPAIVKRKSEVPPQQSLSRIDEDENEGSDEDDSESDDDVPIGINRNPGRDQGSYSGSEREDSEGTPFLGNDSAQSMSTGSLHITANQHKKKKKLRIMKKIKRTIHVGEKKADGTSEEDYVEYDDDDSESDDDDDGPIGLAGFPGRNGGSLSGLDRGDSESTPLFDQNSLHSFANASTGSLHISVNPHKKKKKLRIMKKIKRTIHIGEKKGDGTGESYNYEDDYSGSEGSYDDDDDGVHEKYSTYSNIV